MNRLNGHLPHDESPEPTGHNQELRNELVNIGGDERLLFMEGLDDAIVGLCEVHGQPPRVAYSVDAILEILKTRDGMSEEDAMDWYDFNIAGSYVGPYTPALILSMPGKRVQFEVGDEDDGEAE